MYRTSIKHLNFAMQKSLLPKMLNLIKSSSNKLTNLGRQGGNIEIVVQNSLCVGCGTCVGICPFSAVRMVRLSDIYLPRVDYSRCQSSKGCHTCLEVCPGGGVDLLRLARDLFPGGRQSPLLGRYLSMHIGHSTDFDIRYHAASGGLATQLLLFLLGLGIIDGAVVTALGNGEPFEPRVVFASNREEIVKARSSKYCPVPLNLIIRRIREEKKKVAIVGLPCHIHGFRKAEAKFPAIKKYVVLYLGLFCSSVKTFAGTEYLLHCFGLEKSNVSSFAYRDEGCPGSMHILLKHGSIFKSPYSVYYPRIRSFFIPRRCTLCIDQTAELADISLGDTHIRRSEEDNVGVSSVIVRSDRGKTSLHSAESSRAIELQDLDENSLIKSQWPALERKKHHVTVRFFLHRLFRQRTCNYDYTLPRLSAIQWLKYLKSSLILYAEIAMGKNRRLWWLIDYLDRLAKKLKK